MAACIFYRGFVYDHHMDWNNPKNDRARAAYDNFHDLDGKFDDNVIVQIKNGPIDFQVREPASPLFGALEKTNEAIELQVTQEYFGQAHHLSSWCPCGKIRSISICIRAPTPATPVKSLVTVPSSAWPTSASTKTGIGNQPLAGQSLRLRTARLESGSDRASRSTTNGPG